PMLCNIAFLSHLLSLMPPLPPTSTLFPYNDALPIFHAKPGSRLTLEFRNLDNVWNGVSGSIARELKAVVISEDGRAWKSVPLESLPENRVQLHVEMPGPRLYVARVEPYRLSDLDKFLAG